MMKTNAQKHAERIGELLLNLSVEQLKDLSEMLTTIANGADKMAKVRATAGKTIRRMQAPRLDEYDAHGRRRTRRTTTTGAGKERATLADEYNLYGKRLHRRGDDDGAA